MKYCFAIFLLVITVACHKSLDPATCCTTYYNNIPPALPWNVVNEIVLCCDNNGSVSWVGPNFYEFQFNRTGPAYTLPDGIFAINIADYWAGLYAGQPDTARKFYFKYVGPPRLFDTSRIISRNNWVVKYSVPGNFLNIPLFEARFVNNDSLFQTFLFGDSASTVSVAYFGQKNYFNDPNCGWTCGEYQLPDLPVGLTNDTLTSIFTTYLSNDSLRKKIVHWGSDGSL